MLLMHLSDLHFRRDVINTTLDPDQRQRAALLIDATEKCGELGEAVQAILVSGDIAFAGHPDEYRFAEEWLEELSERCGTGLSSVFVCPGNHDVARNLAGRRLVQALHRSIKNSDELSVDAILRGMLTDAETAQILFEPLNAYNLFAGQFFCDLSWTDRTIASRRLTLNDGSMLQMSALNSALVSSAADKLGDLFVDSGYTQLAKAAGTEHLVMCHHPPYWLRQGQALEDFLNDITRIQLFGHEHRVRVLPGRDWLRVAAAATHPERTEPGWQPGYNFLQLSVTGKGLERRMLVNAHVRVWQQAPGRFVPLMDRDGPIFRSEFKLDPWEAKEAPVRVATVPELASATFVEPMQEEDEMEPSVEVRDLSVRFYKLTLSQKAAIAGKLELLEEEDIDQPDFERFRRVFLRAVERGLIQRLSEEVSELE
jgi:hypothetical protein